MINLTHKIVSTETELESFREGAKNASLPYQDLNYNSQVLISYYENGEMIGTGGLEILERFALLRSVSVSPTHRSQNVGRQITSDIVKKAKDNNLEALYLLTETAKDFFQKLGFETVNREHVPDEIKSTTEFVQVCPASADCMVLKLK